MIDTILGYVVVVVGSALLTYAVLGRLCGFHRPIKWEGGGQLTLVAEFACGTFVLSGGLAILQRTGVWVLPALTAWIIGYVSQRRANRGHIAEENELRQRNAANYPEVFRNAPPDDIDRVHTDELDVFDNGACTYLGRAVKHDLKVLIDQFGHLPDQGPNDIFLIPESLEMAPKDSLSPEFLTLLQKGFEARDFLVLRWMPPSAEIKSVR